MKTIAERVGPELVYKSAGIWADNDRNNPDTGIMIAREVEGEDLALKSQFEDCVKRKKQKIIFDRGSKTLDPNAKSADEKLHEAEEALKQGRCDKSYYGREFCQEFENKRASTFAQDALIEREEAKANALSDFKLKGICDPGLLGKDFCKVEKDKILKNPVFQIPGSGEGTSPFAPRRPERNPTIDTGTTPKTLGPGGFPKLPMNL